MKTLRARASALFLPVILCILALACPPAGHARPGELDTTFNVTGIVTTAIGTGTIDQVNAVVVQTDGKIVVAGASNVGGTNVFAVARYTVAGALDTTFNSTGTKPGTVTTNISGNGDSATSVALQADGKILVAGTTFNGTDNDFALVRYNADGSLDTTFNSAGTKPGTVTTDLNGGDDDLAYSVAVQADGKIVVAGTSGNVGVNDFAVVRYHGSPLTGTPGTLDTTFNTTGIVTTSIGTNSDDEIKSVAVQADGKIVVAGFSSGAITSVFALARYTSAGALDLGFGGGGKLSVPIGSGTFDQIRSMTLQGDGKILVAGFSQIAGNNVFALARFHGLAATGTPGALDNSFGGGNGIVTTTIGIGAQANSVALQANGKIVVAGNFVNGVNLDFALARYTMAGVLDTSFNSAGTQPGTVTTPFGNGDDAATAVAVQKDGKILAVGSTFNGTDNDFALVRYLGDVVTTRDVTGDGNADIVFQLGDSGPLYQYAMNGIGAIASGGYLYAGGTGAKLVGIADMDGDGNADLVFQYGTIGPLYVWHMDGNGGIKDQGFLYQNFVGTTLVAIADMDNDGNADLVFQSPFNGALHVWYMDGHGGIKTNPAGPGGLDQADLPSSGPWKLVAIADMDNDGNADLVFQYPAVGALWVWHMDGNGGIKAKAGGPGGLDQGFLYSGNMSARLAAIADLNNDGNADLIFQPDSVFVTPHVWYMDGKGGIQSQANLVPPAGVPVLPSIFQIR